jgi:hypothetical protein
MANSFRLGLAPEQNPAPEVVKVTFLETSNELIVVPL